MPKDAVTAAEAPGGAADEQYSTAEGAVGVEKAPDPAGDGDDENPDDDDDAAGAPPSRKG